MLTKKQSIYKDPMSEESNEMFQKPKVLSNYIDAFVNWYYIEYIKDRYIDTEQKLEKERLKNFIEKMAVWYELRFPSYEVNRLMPGSSLEAKSIDDIMFFKNPYIREELGEDNEARVLNWSSFYNKETFIRSLPKEEQYYFAPFYYPDIVYLNWIAHLHLNPDGTVEMAENMASLIESKDDSSYEGKTLDEIMQILIDHGIELSSTNEFVTTYTKEQTYKEFQKRLLETVMYRILERGGNRIGPRRAFLFAKEFNCDIRVPLKYGIDFSDPGFRLFIREYLRAGGNTNLRCYIGYCNRLNDQEKLDTFTIARLLKIGEGTAPLYTKEEVKLQRELIETLKKALSTEKLRKEKVNALRLERKLAKSRTNKKREN